MYFWCSKLLKNSILQIDILFSLYLYNIKQKLKSMEKSKHFKALIILAVIVFLSLLSVFFINLLSPDTVAFLEFKRDNYSFYLTGLAALFVILFNAYFYAWRKIFNTVAATCVGLFFIISISNNTSSFEEKQLESAAEECVSEEYVPEYIDSALVDSM